MGLVDTISIDGDHVEVQMLLTTPTCHMVSDFIREVEEQVGDLSGVRSVELQTDHGLEWTEDMMPDEAKARREELFACQAAKYEQELGPRSRLPKMTRTRRTSAASRDPPMSSVSRRRRARTGPCSERAVPVGSRWPRVSRLPDWTAGRRRTADTRTVRSPARPHLRATVAHGSWTSRSHPPAGSWSFEQPLGR
ncbi:hypothetical protein CV102_17035 [Natronococcus pandeyae]|uniref:MIP18 family-like domain-containing protein n=1 Tax=Natronococcus pandeyae TaxID=2055836 RepID=A0A8J8TR39_9EURY|nr:hypothetical protein CV102_17035 [Natronococcus pandeyae]